MALRTPYKPLLDYAMTYVSLSRNERSCVLLCVVDGLTEEEAAEELQRSRDFVAKHKKAGLCKLCKAWDACPVIPLLLE